LTDGDGEEAVLRFLFIYFPLVEQALSRALRERSRKEKPRFVGFIFLAEPQ
jgi:hypothetical protein